MFGPYQMLMDFGIMSILLIFAHLLRSKLKILQYIYMPSSLIAGFIALFCGWQFLDILPFAVKENGTPYISSYPYLLVVLLFAGLFLGKDENAVKVPFRRW